MDLADSTCVALTTYRRNGDGVTTPVWISRLPDGRLGFYTAMGTGKTKRLRRDPRLTLQPCGWSGRLKPGTVPVTGTAELHQGDGAYDETMAAIRKKYGLKARLALTAGPLTLKRHGLTYADTAVVVTLD
ncbi:PPOX class F420-dependent oxidoreductase [Nocardioides sp. KR10-350]|uniref:PPOX class F420-dependent oxidoreductase n=1 Tax=Nocardioides cheoyonin TaxID=3156615 RepID=UPI0032B5CBEF